MKVIILSVALLLATQGPTSATEAEARFLKGVASVIDGDTMELHGTRVRLHGIDAAESAQLCIERNGSIWRCGQEAALSLADKIDRTPILCEQLDTDRYGRVVARCFSNGQDLNKWMVLEGMAVAYRQYSSDYVADENRAREGRRGMWRTKFNMLWDWRKGARSLEVPPKPRRRCKGSSRVRIPAALGGHALRSRAAMRRIGISNTAPGVAALTATMMAFPVKASADAQRKQSLRRGPLGKLTKIP